MPGETWLAQRGPDDEPALRCTPPGDAKSRCAMPTAVIGITRARRLTSRTKSTSSPACTRSRGEGRPAARPLRRAAVSRARRPRRAPWRRSRTSPTCRRRRTRVLQFARDVGRCRALAVDLGGQGDAASPVGAARRASAILPKVASVFCVKARARASGVPGKGRQRAEEDLAEVRIAPGPAIERLVAVGPDADEVGQRDLQRQANALVLQSDLARAATQREPGPRMRARISGQVVRQRLGVERAHQVALAPPVRQARRSGSRRRRRTAPRHAAGRRRG